MTSKNWVNGYKLSAVIGTIFGLLLPGLPLLATPSGIVENSSSATSGDLLIAQNGTPCDADDRLFDTFTTVETALVVSICQDSAKAWYIGILNLNGGDYNYIYGVTRLEDGSYKATKIEDGTEYVYYVGDSLTIVSDGNVLVDEAFTDD